MKGGLLLLLPPPPLLQLRIIITMALSLVLVRGTEDGGRERWQKKNKNLKLRSGRK
jgi:hypothetical protein